MNTNNIYVAQGPLPRALRDALESGDPLGFDVENEFDPGRDVFPHLVTLQVSTGTTAWVLDARTTNVTADPVLRGWLADPDRPKRIHFAAHEARILRLHGLRLDGVQDTCLAAKLLYLGTGQPDREQAGISVSLQALASRYLGVVLDKTHQTTFGLTASLTPAQVDYAGFDATAAFHLWPILAAECNSVGLGSVLGLECALVGWLDQLTEAGVPVDPERWAKAIAALEHAKADAEDRIAAIPDPTAILGVVGTINVAAHAQVLAMFATAGVQVDNVRKETLEPLRRDLADLADRTSDQEMQLEALSAYLSWVDANDQLRWNGRPDGDSRLRGSWNQLLNTGRVGVSDHNLHGIPKPLRSTIGGVPGRELRKLDYGNQEGRIIAALSGDSRLIAELNAGSEAHQELADEVGTTRDRAKKARFAYWYGRGEKEMAADLDLPVSTTRRLRQALASRYPAALEFVQNPPTAPAQLTALTAELDGDWLEVRTGDRRRLLGPSTSPAERAATRRAAGNFRVQAVGATMSKRAFGRASKLLADRFGAKARIVNFVHDELLLEADVDVVDEAAEVVAAAMRWAFERTIGTTVACDVNVTGGTHYVSD